MSMTSPSFYSDRSSIRVTAEDDDEYDNEFLQSDKSCSSLVDFETIVGELGVGKFQYKMFILTGGGFFAMCSELFVFVLSSGPAKELWGTSASTFAWLPFFMALASITGCLISGKCSDEYGRRWPFIVGIGICTVFGLASAFAPTFWTFVLLRALVSLGIGTLFSVDFTLMIEFLPKAHRGAYMVGITLSGTIGVLYVAGMAWILLPMDKWRLFIVVSAFPSCLIFLLRLAFNVESPKYYLVSGQYAKALSLLTRIGVDNDTKDALTGKTVFYSPEPRRGQFHSLFSSRHALTTVHLTLVWILHTAGYWGVTIFLPQYLDQFGLNRYMLTFITICSEIPGLALAMYLIDNAYLGRLGTWMIYCCGSCLSLIGVVLCDSLVSVLPLFVCLAYFFIVPVFAIMQTYTPEVYPTWLRSTAMAYVNVMNSFPEMVTAFFGAQLLGYDDRRLYPLVWAVIFFLEALVIFTMSKETVNLKLDNEDDHTRSLDVAVDA